MEDVKQIEAKCGNEKGRTLLMAGEEAQEEEARTRFVASNGNNNNNNNCQLDVFFGS